MRTRHKRLCEYINPIIGKQGSVLDVGAGSGGYAIAFASAGHKVVAIEPNLSVPEINDHVEVLHDSWPTSQLEGRLFDVILCVQVLEHFVHPVEAVRQMLEHLTVGGLLYLEIPSGDWVLNHSAIADVHFPHRHYFTTSSFQWLTTELNLEITHSRDLGGRVVGYVIQDRRKASETEPTSQAAFPRHQGLLEAAEYLQSRLTAFKGCTALYGANANTQALLGWYPDIACDVILDDTPEYWGHHAYSLTKRIPVVKPSTQNLKGLERIIIASYNHDREILLEIRELGFTGDVVSLRPPTAVVDGPPSLFS
jgi:SAM-dependent methyltransferase